MEKGQREVLDRFLKGGADMSQPLTCLEGWLIALRLQNCSPHTLCKNELIPREFLQAINAEDNPRRSRKAKEPVAVEA